MIKCEINGCEKDRWAKGFCGKHYQRYRVHGDPEKTKCPGNGVLLSFLRNLSETDDCIIWPFGREKNGYGMMRFEGRQNRAHRVSLILATKTNPTDLEAAHGCCHNKLCVNPKHLSWKTPTENQIDKIRDGTDNRGEKHVNSKLTKNNVIAIRSDARTHQKIAKDYNVSRRHVSRIKAGCRWAWLNVQ